MPSEQDKSAIITRVQELLTAARARGIHLQLTSHRLNDGWLYLVVEPMRRGERASEHAHFMTEIERTLQKEGHDQVLLVPAVPEHASLTDVPKNPASAV
jgi:hypothetical protein